MFDQCLLPHDDSRASHPRAEAAASRNRLDKGKGARQGSKEGWGEVCLCTLGAQSQGAPQGTIPTRGRAASYRQRNGILGNYLLQALQESVTCGRESHRNCWPDARDRQVSWLLLGDDLRGFSRGSQARRNLLVELSVDPANSMRLRQKQPRLKLDPEEYTTVRRRVLERDGWRCQECGSMEILQVHHMKPRSRLGDDVLYNLITLCVDCHRKSHGVHGQR